MLHQHMLDRNPALIDAAVTLHQSGAIPANSWLFDLDAISSNARLFAAEAKRLGLVSFYMSKQVARNPLVVSAVLGNGLDATVAVDVQCADILHRYGFPIGHVGHLGQIPFHAIARVLAMKPEFWTVYSLGAAEAIANAARAAGTDQDLLIRVQGPDDVFFAGQEGGFSENEVVDAVRAIMRLPNVQVVGLTAFPCVEYTFDWERMPPATTRNLGTIIRAARKIETALGLTMLVIDAPGNTSTETLAMLANAGATHVEPGQGITGTTLTQIALGTAPETPAYVYVSEISHFQDDLAYAFGGGLASLMSGFFRDEWQPQAFVGDNPEKARRNPVDYHHVQQIIDYHLPLHPAARCRIGDTVVMPFYTQAQMTRSYTVAVAGVSTGNPQVIAICDHAGTMLDAAFNPMPLEDALRIVAEV